MPMTCPRCAIPLVSTSIEWVSSCGRCGGIFAARTVGPIGKSVVEAAEAASDRAQIRATTTSRVACPVCSRTATRESFRSIEVDRCGDHGIWFDRDEILHVISRTRPKTLAGLGNSATGAAGAVTAANLMGRPANLSGEGAVDLADVGLEAAVPAITAEVEQSDAAAWMVVDAVAGLFDPE